MMQLHPHYSSSFDETGIKSIKDEQLIETDQLRSASIRLIIFTSKLHLVQADHPNWTSWSSSCGRTFSLRGRQVPRWHDAIPPIDVTLSPAVLSEFVQLITPPSNRFFNYLHRTAWIKEISWKHIQHCCHFFQDLVVLDSDPVIVLLAPWFTPEFAPVCV